MFCQVLCNIFYVKIMKPIIVNQESQIANSVQLLKRMAGETPGSAESRKLDGFLYIYYYNILQSKLCRNIQFVY